MLLVWSACKHLLRALHGQAAQRFSKVGQPLEDVLLSLRTSSSAGIGAAVGAVLGAVLWGPSGAAVAGALGAGVASYVVQRRREHQAPAS